MNDQPQQQEPPTPGTSGCQTCDLGEVDGLACKAKRYQKQAEVMTQVAKDLDDYKTQYAGARKAYGEAWEAAAEETKGIRTQLDEIQEFLECRLEPEHKRCLDDAATEVFEDLDECARPPPGCCVGDCEYDDSVGEDEDAAGLGDRIAAYRRSVEAATACFTSLVGEPKELTDRIAATKAEATSLAEDVAKPNAPASTLARWYARYLIAVRALDPTHIGHGFTSVKDYVDCLCKALQCLAAGWAAIAVLEGARAEVACLEDAKKTACADKQKDVLVAILAGYDCCIEGTKGSGGDGKTDQEHHEEKAPETST